MKKLVLSSLLTAVLLTVSSCSSNGGGNASGSSRPGDTASAVYQTSEKLQVSFEQFAYTIPYGTKEITITIVPGTEIDGNRLSVGGKMLDFTFVGVYELQILDNLVVLATYDTDIRSCTLYAFDMDGNKRLEVYALDDCGMVINDFGYGVEGNKFRIQNGKILLQGSRLTHGPALVLNSGDSLLLLENGEWVNTVPDSEDIEACFEILYMGNGQFGPIEKTETTLTYGQYKKTAVLLSTAN